MIEPWVLKYLNALFGYGGLINYLGFVFQHYRREFRSAAVLGVSAVLYTLVFLYGL